jgi:hypothetical protein
LCYSENLYIYPGFSYEIILEKSDVSVASSASFRRLVTFPNA